MVCWPLIAQQVPAFFGSPMQDRGDGNHHKGSDELFGPDYPKDAKSGITNGNVNDDASLPAVCTDITTLRRRSSELSDELHALRALVSELRVEAGHVATSRIVASMEVASGRFVVLHGGLSEELPELEVPNGQANQAIELAPRAETQGGDAPDAAWSSDDVQGGCSSTRLVSKSVSFDDILGEASPSQLACETIEGGDVQDTAIPSNELVSQTVKGDGTPNLALPLHEAIQGENARDGAMPLEKPVLANASCDHTPGGALSVTALEIDLVGVEQLARSLEERLRRFDMPLEADRLRSSAARLLATHHLLQVAKEDANLQGSAAWRQEMDMLITMAENAAAEIAQVADLITLHGFTEEAAVARALAEGIGAALQEDATEL